VTKFLLWLILFVLCWPLALLVLILFPLVWLIALPFRLAGAAVSGCIALLKAIFLLPSRGTRHLRTLDFGLLDRGLRTYSIWNHTYPGSPIR